jgi:hypothetical protein
VIVELVDRFEVHATIVASAVAATTGYNAGSAPLTIVLVNVRRPLASIVARAAAALRLSLASSSHAIAIEPSEAIAICG